MAIEIRELLADAQRAETSGDKPKAIELLEKAAVFFRDRGLTVRANQMLRHARRLEGKDVSDEALAGFMPQHLEQVDEETRVTPPETAELQLPPLTTQWQARAAAPAPNASPGNARKAMANFERGPQLSDPSVDAWCSFCCRPKKEVGALVAGPAGAYICAACSATSHHLLGGGLAADRKRTDEALEPVSTATGALLLPGQDSALKRLEARKPKVALIVGPEGAGKSALLRRLGRPLSLPLDRLSGDRVLLDLEVALAVDDARRLVRWLDEHDARTVVIAVRGTAPAPVLVLKGESGDEPVFDTASLVAAVGERLTAELVSRIDAVLALDAPDRAALLALAKGALEARGAAIPEAALEQLVDLAVRSGRGAHELVALVARIPSGKYTGAESA